MCIFLLYYKDKSDLYWGAQWDLQSFLYKTASGQSCAFYKVGLQKSVVVDEADASGRKGNKNTDTQVHTLRTLCCVAAAVDTHSFFLAAHAGHNFWHDTLLFSFLHLECARHAFMAV